MSLYEAIKDAVSAAKDVKDAAIKSAIAKVEIEVAQATLELAECKTELARAREELQMAREQLDLRSSLIFEANVYWRSVGPERDGPFCAACVDQHAKLIRLHLRDGMYGSAKFRQCPICKTRP